MTKTEARKIVNQRKKQLSDQYKKSADRSILKQILDMDLYKKADTIFCYASMEDEVDTWCIIKDALEHGKRVGVPLCMEKGMMEVHQIQTLEDFKQGAYGIMEPKSDSVILPKDEIQIGIIPCVSADEDRNRLGHGAGYYDRYLEGTTFPKILLCWKQLMLSKVPVDAHDILMDMVISE